MKRLLHFSLLIFAFALYGIGVNIISGVVAEPALKQGLASQPEPSEPAPTTTTVAELATTTTAAQAPRMSSTAPRNSRLQVSTTTPKQPTTTTTKSPKNPLEIAQSQVGKIGPYAEGGFWCAKFASWVAEQAKVEGWKSSDSPARLHTIAEDQGRLTDTPRPGHLVFIDLTGENNVNDYVTHIGIVESVEGSTVHTIEGNADDSGLVTRQVHELGDGFVIDFAPFEKELQ